MPVFVWARNLGLGTKKVYRCQLPAHEVSVDILQQHQDFRVVPGADIAFNGGPQPLSSNQFVEQFPCLRQMDAVESHNEPATIRGN